jgi:hypothetical protein
VLGAVTGLSLSGKSTLTWTATPGAERYDVAWGNLGTLRASAGNFTSATAGCVENDGADTSSWSGAAPPAGSGFFDLVRASTTSCGLGTFDGPSPPQVGTRDGEIAASNASCP